MSGTAGTFYQQFGLTMAIAIGFSALNALTLSPALCALFLKPHTTETTLKERMGTAYKESRKILVARYTDVLGKWMNPKIVILFTIVAILGMIFGLFSFGEHPVLCIVMIIISVLAFAGMTTDKFKNSFTSRIIRCWQNIRNVSYSLFTNAGCQWVWLPERLCFWSYS